LRSEREKGPVLRSEHSWVVLGRVEAEKILRAPTARSGFMADLYRELLPPGAARDEMGSRINFLDPPDHGRVRGLVAKAFTPRRVAELRPFLRRLCASLLERIDGRESVDLIEDYAHAVPALTISELLGVPPEQRDRLTALSDQVAGLLSSGALDGAGVKAALEAAEELHAYLRALLERRRREPADDLVSALLAAREGDVRLSEAELLSLCATLYSAGHRTTRDLFTNGLTALLPDAGLRNDIAAGRLSLADVTEEFLRYETPTHYVARMLTEPLELAGTTVAAGEPIMLGLAAANRDPDVYADADRFDPHRWASEPPPPPPLSFVFGLHFCLGASLARLEVEVMLEALLDRFPAIQMIQSADELRWRHTGVFRGLEELLVRPSPG
jgi:cytochrome P450